MVARRRADLTAGSAVASVISSRSGLKTRSHSAATAARRSGGTRALSESQKIVGWLYQGLLSTTP